MLGEGLGVGDPAAAHRLVEVGVGLEQIGLRGDVGELRAEERLLGGGDFQVEGRAFAVAQGGEVAEALQGGDVACLNFARLAELGVVDERVFHVLEGPLNRSESSTLSKPKSAVRLMRGK